MNQKLFEYKLIVWRTKGEPEVSYHKDKPNFKLLYEKLNCDTIEILKGKDYTVSEKVFDIKKYLTYTDFKRAIGEGVVSQAEKRIRPPGVSLSDIETFLGKNNDW